MTEAEKKALAELKVGQIVNGVAMQSTGDQVRKADAETSASNAALWGIAVGAAVTFYYAVTHDMGASAVVGGVLVLAETLRRVPSRVIVHSGIKKIEAISENMLAMQQRIVEIEQRPQPEVVLAEEALKQARLDIAARQKFDQVAAAEAQKRTERLAEIERRLDKSIGYHGRYKEGMWTTDDFQIITGEYVPEWKDLLRRVNGMTELESLEHVRSRYGQLLAVGQNSQYKNMVEMLRDTLGTLDQQIEATRPKPPATS